MSALTDHLAATLAEEIAASGIRVFAATSPLTVAAALAARAIGAPDLAIAGGFTRLDASPVPSLTLGEAGLLGDQPGPSGCAGDVFALLAHGWCGVAVTPAQLDARGCTNLSGIGPPGRPTVALPGSRGLPDNNASAGRVWYLLGAHSPRALVAAVDVVSGPAPDLRSPRRLLTEAGLFELTPAGWRAVWLTEGGAELVAAAPGLGVALLDGTPVRPAPTPAALAAVRAADPHRVRDVEMAGREEGGRLWSAHAGREAQGA